MTASIPLAEAIGKNNAESEVSSHFPDCRAGVAGHLVLHESRGHEIDASGVMRLADHMRYDKRIDQDRTQDDDDAAQRKTHLRRRIR